MTYLELNENEKQELRGKLFYDSYYGDEDNTEFYYLTDAQKEIVINCDYPGQIPEEIMIAAFGCYDFVPDDFWCNLEDNNH